MNLFELKTDSVCNLCQNEYLCSYCNRLRLSSENINTNNKDDCYSIYSNFCEIRYLQQQAQPKVTKVQDKENIGSFYRIASDFSSTGNKTVAVPYTDLMSEYNRVKSKRYR